MLDLLGRPPQEPAPADLFSGVSDSLGEVPMDPSNQIVGRGTGRWKLEGT